MKEQFMNEDIKAPKPTDSIPLTSPTPAWFDWAIEQACESKFVEVEDCRIHYLLWESTLSAGKPPSLLLVHGGGAHANWWRFVAPFFAKHFRVAAIDLSGMGDSGVRESYSAAVRAKEIQAVIRDAGFGEDTFVVGHSFGGFMTLRYGVDFGDQIAGAIIADTPVRHPDDPPPGRASRIFKSTRPYPTYEEAVARFRLLPAQECENDFIVEYIARHSLKRSDDGWVWKFHPSAMGADRWAEPFHEHMQNMRCRTAYIHGESSALINPSQLEYIKGLMKPESPIVELPQAHHHMMLDQPLGFVAMVRSIIDCWRRF